MFNLTTTLWHSISLYRHQCAILQQEHKLIKANQHPLNAQLEFCHSLGIHRTTYRFIPGAYHENGKPYRSLGYRLKGMRSCPYGPKEIKFDFELARTYSTTRALSEDYSHIVPELSKINGVVYEPRSERVDRMIIKSPPKEQLSEDSVGAMFGYSDIYRGSGRSLHLLKKYVPLSVSRSACLAYLRDNTPQGEPPDTVGID